MRTLLLLLSALLLAVQAYSQPFLVGTTSLTLHDDVRNRDVPSTVYYPAIVAGADQAVTAGSFSTLIFGHGFVMTVSAYAYLGQHYATKGYIVVLPTTEGGFAPDHGRFGLDLAFLAGALQALGTDANSPFFEHVGPSTVLMGHSMGGGAALLGAANNVNIQAVVVLAPAETNPSAITACASITVPTLIFGASEDCVTPIATNTQPMYDATAASCKAFVNILGGGHCYFGDASTTCSLGEFTCGPDLTVDRGQQHQTVLDVTDLWLDHFIGGSAEAFITLADTLSTSTRFTASFDCLSTGVTTITQEVPFTAQWMPTTHSVALSGLELNDLIVIHDVTGKVLAQGSATSESSMLKIPSGVNGILLVRLQRNGQRYLRRVPAID